MFDFLEFQPDPNRQRYELMIQRRQALLEVGKLRNTITVHVEWKNALEMDAELGKILEQQLFSLDSLLCQKFCQADSAVLEVDLQNIYIYLIKLSKIWVALENNQPVIPVIHNQFATS